METPIPPELSGTVRKASRFLWSASLLIVLLIAATVGAYAWYTLYHPCRVDAVQQASSILISQMKSYDKEYQFAVTASRTSLMHPVRVLQQIHRDTKAVAVPACMQTAKNELISYMGTVIRAFQAFDAGEADATIRDLINQSEAHYDDFAAELEAVQECAPFCR